MYKPESKIASEILGKGKRYVHLLRGLKGKDISTFKEGRFTHYEVLISIEDYRKMLLNEIVERLYQGNRTKLVEELS